MVSGTTSQIRSTLDAKDFSQKCLDHETFILHLLQEDQIHKGPFALQSIFIDPAEHEKLFHGAGYIMVSWINKVNLPYYEMLMKDAVDIMVDFGYPSNWIYDVENKDFYKALLIIHKGKVIFNTQTTCYCFEAINEAIAQFNPDLFILD
jgi:hypothetical protein